MNRKVTVLALCLVAAFAVSGVVSALASATTMVLPTFSAANATTFTGKSAKGTLTVAGGASIKCETSTDSAEITTGKDEGKGTLKFETCSQGGVQCRSLGDALPTILATGTWKLLLRTNAGVDQHLFLFTLPTAGLHIECPLAAVELLLVAGEVLGGIAPKSGSTTTFILTVAGTAQTGQEIQKYENNSGTLVSVTLKTQQEGGAAKGAYENSETNELIFGATTTIEN